MAVNQEIYGSSEQWVSTYYQQNELTNKNKKAWFGGSTAQTQLRAGVAAGKLSYSEPIDKTLAYCGFGTESALNHRAFIGRDPENTGALKIFEYQDSDISNWAFFEKTAQYGETSALAPALDNGYIRLDDLGRTAWNENINDDWNYSKYLEPYTFINPHNMVLLINVIAGASLDTSQQIDLATYIQNRASYPYLYTVYGNLYFGTYPNRNIFADKGTPATGWKTSTLQCLDNYVCQAKNLDLPMYSITYGGSCILMGTPTKNRIMLRDADILNIAYVTEEAKEHLKIPTVSGDSHCYIEYYDNLIEDILKTAACLGLYFTPSSSVAISGSLTDENMYIGILDSSGIGHGDYLRGAQTVNAPQAAASFIDMHSIGYDPMSGDHTRYINDTLFYGTWSSSAFTKMYVLTDSEVSLLANELYTAVSQAPQGEEIERYNQSVFLTQNPIDCIISLKKFPMELPFSASVPIKLGSYTCQQATGAPLLYSTGIYSFRFSRTSNNGLSAWFDESFLDYEQYTKVELTVPFCGTVEIPCCYLYEYDAIEVKLIVDFITGACTAYILSRGITIDSVSGSCSVSLPVNGIQSANLDSQIYSAASARNKSALTSGLGLIGGLAAIGVGIATGGIGAAVLGGIAAITSGANLVVQDKKIEYELQHMQLPLKQISAASGAISQSYDMRCKMRITRPKLDPDYDPEVYADTVGFACLMQGQVSDFTGLTVGEIDLDGVAAPEPVKKMIQSLFAEGVYL